MPPDLHLTGTSISLLAMGQPSTRHAFSRRLDGRCSTLINSKRCSGHAPCSVRTVRDGRTDPSSTVWICECVVWRAHFYRGERNAGIPFHLKPGAPQRRNVK
jgi:hypothetical protein